MQVPVYQRQVQQQGLPNARENIQVDASNFLGGTEAAALKYGENALDNVNKAVQHHYAQQLYEAQKTRVLDAATQFQTHAQDLMYGKNGFLNKTGSSAFLGSDGKSASDLLFDDAIAKQNAIADTLGDDEQKAMFKQSTSSMLMTMRGQAMGHEAQQHRVYVQSTLESSNASNVNNIALNYNDHDSIAKSIDQIHANSNQLATLQGYGPEWGAVHAQTNISGALNKVVDAAIDRNDHKTAIDILQQFSPHMNQNDLLTNFNKINKAQGTVNAVQAANATMVHFGTQFVPQDGDRLFNLQFNQESGNKQLNGKYYGLREDGTPKGTGWLGEIKLPNGNVATEYSIGVNINGKEMEIPSIVRGLSSEELTQMTHDVIPNNKAVPDAILQKAVDHAKAQLAKGESVWHDTPDPVTSPKGAIGAAQLIPDTAHYAAELAGLPWNENKYKYDYDYNTALGKAYMQKLLQDNHADYRKALAAYNAGPGALKNALAKADKEGGDYLSYLPKETQDYVNSISSKYTAGGGVAPEPTLEEVQKHTLSLLQNATPQEQQTAIQEVTRQYSVHQQAIKDHNDYSIGQVIKQLWTNKGDLNAIPQSMLDAIPPEHLQSIQNFAKSQQEGKRESNKALYNHLTSNPDYLASLSEDQLLKLAPELSDADFKHFSNQRASLLKPEAGNSPSVLDTGAVNTYLNNLLDIQKIPTTGKDADPEQLGAIRKFVNDSLLSSQAQTGNKFTDAEVSSKINELFAKNVQFRKTFLGFTTGISNRQVIATNVDDIDKNTVAQIKEQFGKRGIDNPTNGQILGAYFNGMSK